MELLKKLKLNIGIDDVIAIIMILGCIYLIAMGYDRVITSVLIAISSYYFGHKRLTQ